MRNFRPNLTVYGVFVILVLNIFDHICDKMGAYSQGISLKETNEVASVGVLF